MRRTISLILALVICFSLACSVSATTDSPSNTAPSTSTGTGSYTASSVSDNPKTGDTGNMQLWVPMMACSAVGLVAVLFVYNKKSRV